MLNRVMNAALAATVTALLLNATCGTAEAFGHHQRAITAYSLPSTPVVAAYAPAPVVAAYAPAPVVVARPVVAAPVIAAPVAPVVTAAYAPVAAPVTTYYAPAP